MTKHPWVKGDTSSEETEYLLQKPYDDCVGGVSGNSACYDSIRKQVSISILDDGI